MPTARPSDAISARPRTICMVASVVISALMRKRAMTTPLTRPTKPPQASAAIRPRMIEPVAFEAMTAIMPEKATVEPTDRSKSRDARQNIMVQATMPMVTTDCSRPSMLRSVRKLGTVSDTIAKASGEDDHEALFAEKKFSSRDVIGVVPVNAMARGVCVSGRAAVRMRRSSKSGRSISAAMRPSHMTMMRSEMPMTSGNSLEMTTIAMPPGGKLVEDLVDFRLGADIDAARRLVDDQNLDALFGQPAAENDLLLVAAGEIDDVLLARRRADARAWR